MSRNKQKENFNNTWKALVSAIKSLYKAMPLLMGTFTIIMFCILRIFCLNSTLQMILLTFVIFISSMAVYFKSKNYGEAVLALSAGLFTVYTVNWNYNLVVGFVVVWGAFTIIVMLVTTVKMTAQLEDIYLDAVYAIKTKNEDNKTVEKKLRGIANSLQKTTLGPIEKAEIIRNFAFKKLSISDMEVGLKWVSVFYVLIRIDYLVLADFVIVVIKQTRSHQNVISIDRIFDYIYEGMRSAAASPTEYIDVFGVSKHHLMKCNNVINYFDALKLYFEQDITIDEVNTYFTLILSTK